MSDERWRCFVAIPIGEALRAELRTAADAWRAEDALAGLRWTEPESWHITLAFLGSIKVASVAGLRERLARVATRHPIVRTGTGGLGAFPGAARARVVWYGVEDGTQRLARLSADVAEVLGLDASRPYHPHLTLARARRQAVDLRSWLASASGPDGVLVVDRIELMRSHTASASARYETLASITLGVPAGV
jgi:RNA 2',3'-cyclic 3'-phosphodiesterase